jgi:pimeloyl-ACP methyl ester carboxylesterase
MLIFVLGCGGSSSVTTPASPVAFLGPLQHKQVGDVNYAYYRFGKGKPLVLICAFGVTISNWSASLLEELGSRYEVITFDNRGMGLSTDASTDPLTIDSMAESTYDFLVALDVKKPNVLAWSMGTYVTNTLALDHPGFLDKLILVGGDAGGPNTIPPTAEFMAVAELPNPTFAQVASILFPPGHQTEIDRYKAQLDLMPLDPATPDQRNRQLSAFSLWQLLGVWDFLGDIQNEALIIHGTEDISSPIANPQAMANMMPNAMLVQFPDAGHAVLFQEQETCMELIHRFLG